MTAELTRYKVYLTPRTGLTSYGTEEEITHHVIRGGFQNLRKTIDSVDYGVGIFVFGDIDLTLENSDGYFNDETDPRSVFDFRRDLSKLRIEFFRNVVTYASAGHVTSSAPVETTRFDGLIFDEAAQTRGGENEARFRVLSLDSILRRTPVPGGFIPNGITAENAIKKILSSPKVQSVLGYDDSNINVVQDFTIDFGFGLDDKIMSDALEQLLFATDSALYLDSSNEVIVAGRGARNGLSTINLYGPFKHGLSNISELENFNSGMNRLFTAVKVNDTLRADQAMVDKFGHRQKDITLPFITSTDTAAVIAARVLNTFKVQRPEMTVTVPVTEFSSPPELLQPVAMDWPFRYVAADENKPPVWGHFEWDGAVWPHERGQRIHPNVKWKIIEIEEELEDFAYRLKLRQDGEALGEGYF